MKDKKEKHRRTWGSSETRDKKSDRIIDPLEKAL